MKLGKIVVGVSPLRAVKRNDHPRSAKEDMAGVSKKAGPPLESFDSPNFAFDDFFFPVTETTSV